MSRVLRRRVSAIALLAAALVLLLAPATAEAQQARESRADIRILSDAEFDAAHGVRSGSGTTEDPFVISGWVVNNLYIKDTDASVVITDNTVRSVMTLDWIGRDVTVTENTVRDLRVNQNVRRTGLPTSGVISDNTFDVVGQLRHWDGEFSRNHVGRPTADSPYNSVSNEVFANRAVNFDGFNGAHFTDNDIYGYVDVRIHGHHHSSAFGDDSHNHAGADHEAMDHSQRYHEVFFHHNRITVPAGEPYAVQYVDNNHAGNDRTATSETNPALNDPHIHYTRIHMTDNVLQGAGVSVNIFNASDSRHLATSRGLFEIDRNTITLTPSSVSGSGATTGISVQQADDVDLYIRNNSIVGPAHRTADSVPFASINAPAGISLFDIHLATIRIYDNHVANTTYGVRSSQFTPSVRWLIGGLHLENVKTPIAKDSSVANNWEERPAEEGGTAPPDDGGGHHHG